ncbi:unnamed protein product, partial [marine sediment metagenome]
SIGNLPSYFFKCNRILLIIMPTKKFQEEIKVKLKGISNACNINQDRLGSDYNEYYGYQLTMDGQPISLSSYKRERFDGFLEGFKEGCRLKQ